MNQIAMCGSIVTVPVYGTHVLLLLMYDLDLSQPNMFYNKNSTKLETRSLPPPAPQEMIHGAVLDIWAESTPVGLFITATNSQLGPIDPLSPPYLTPLQR